MLFHTIYYVFLVMLKLIKTKSKKLHKKTRYIRKRDFSEIKHLFGEFEKTIVDIQAHSEGSFQLIQFLSV